MKPIFAPEKPFEIKLTRTAGKIRRSAGDGEDWAIDDYKVIIKGPGLTPVNGTPFVTLIGTGFLRPVMAGVGAPGPEVFADINWNTDTHKYEINNGQAQSPKALTLSGANNDTLEVSLRDLYDYNDSSLQEYLDGFDYVQKLGYHTDSDHENNEGILFDYCYNSATGARDCYCWIGTDGVASNNNPAADPYIVGYSEAEPYEHEEHWNVYRPFRNYQYGALATGPNVEFTAVRYIENNESFLIAVFNEKNDSIESGLTALETFAGPLDGGYKEYGGKLYAPQGKYSGTDPINYGMIKKSTQGENIGSIIHGNGETGSGELYFEPFVCVKMHKDCTETVYNSERYEFNSSGQLVLKDGETADTKSFKDWVNPLDVHQGWDADGYQSFLLLSPGDCTLGDDFPEGWICIYIDGETMLFYMQPSGNYELMLGSEVW